MPGETISNRSRVRVRNGFAQTNILMTNVLHHVADVPWYCRDASWCLCRGRKIVRIEAWLIPWSRFVCTRPHHNWSFPRTVPLSGANAALPWILFEPGEILRGTSTATLDQVRPFLSFRFTVASTKVKLVGFLLQLYTISGL